MAPHQTQKTGMSMRQADKIDKPPRIEALLRFSEKARTTLSSSPTPAVSSQLSKEFQEHIDHFPKGLSSLKSMKRQDIDNEGLTLWNLCIRLLRTNEAQITKPSDVLLAARVFAFHLLDAANAKAAPTGANVVRLMKTALKAGKSCLESNHFDYAFKVFEKAADYREQLQKFALDKNTADDEAQIYSQQQAEYYVLRTCLAWKQNQLDVAELMFSHANLPARAVDSDSAEKLADLLYNIGQDCSKKKQFDLAIKWLQRAHEVLQAQEPERLSIDASDLGITITQSRVQALLALQNDEAFAQATQLVDLLESVVGGDRLLVLLLRLEILNAPLNPHFDTSSYADIIHKVIRTVMLTDSNFKLIMHHIRKLNDKAPGVACNMLDTFLQRRLLTEGTETWVETAVVNRVFISTQAKDGMDVFTGVRGCLDVVVSGWKTALSLSATHACQTLLWKRVEDNVSHANLDLAENWCRVCLHKAFEDSGDMNKAKIARKLLIIALQRHDIPNVRELLALIPSTAIEDPNTQFLMFKVALRTDDHELAAEALDKVYAHAKKDATLLYACVLDAQQNGDKQITIKALQMVLEKYEYNAPDGVHIPALIRCTIRLLISQLEAKDVEDENKVSLVEELCKLFDGAARKALQVLKRPEEKDVLWTVPELDWFSKNAYNLALKHSKTWPPRLVLSLVQSCLTFGSIYPSSLPQASQDDILLRSLFCSFLASVLLIALARLQDNIEQQLQDYLELRKHVASFDEKLQSKMEDLEEGPKQDLVKKLGTMLLWDFEAAIRLKKWEDLGDCVLKAEACESMRVYEGMCDMLLAGEKQEGIPVMVTINILKQLTNAAWTLSTLPITTLGRYYRCLFRLSLQLPSPSPVPLELLTQIAGLAEQAKESEIPYPDDELEYLSTTAFNKAVDYYCIEDDENCQSWANSAVEISGFINDGGSLRGLLQERLVGLRFDRGSEEI